MITEPLSFTGKLSLQDAIDIHRLHSQIVIRPVIRWLMAIISATMMVLTIFLGLHSHFSPSLFFLLAIFAFFPFGLYVLNRWNVRWHYRRNQENFIDHTVTFTNERVSTASAKGEIRLNWDRLASVAITPRSLLFLVPPHEVWFWLPQRLFEGNTYKKSILELAAEHKVPLRQMA